jgi:hypothetical protein
MLGALRHAGSRHPRTRAIAAHDSQSTHAVRPALCQPVTKLETGCPEP